MAYLVTLTPSVQKYVARLPKDIRARIASRLEELAENPRMHGAVKLSGADEYRARVGDYRIIYSIFDDRLIVVVIDVGHRGDVYRRM